MKSINAIANKNNFDANKVKQVVAQLEGSISPHAMGDTLFLAGDDINTVIQTYRAQYMQTNEAA